MRVVWVDPGIKNFFSGRNASSTSKKGLEGKVGYLRGPHRLRENLVEKEKKKRERYADFMVGKCIVSEHLDSVWLKPSHLFLFSPALILNLQSILTNKQWRSW